VPAAAPTPAAGVGLSVPAPASAGGARRLQRLLRRRRVGPTVSASAAAAATAAAADRLPHNFLVLLPDEDLKLLEAVGNRSLLLLFDALKRSLLLRCEVLNHTSKACDTTC